MRIGARLLIAATLAVGLGSIGCGKSDDDTTVPPQVALNPGGKPQTPEEDAMAQRQRAGAESAQREMAASAKAAADARAKSGGK